MAADSRIQGRRVIRRVLGSLLVFCLLFVASHVLIQTISPSTKLLRLGYFTGGPDCSELARHLRANNPNDVHFNVMPLGGVSFESVNVCWIDIVGDPESASDMSTWYVGDAAQPLVKVAQNFRPSAGIFGSRLTVRPTLGAWHGPLVFVLAFLGAAGWHSRKSRQGAIRGNQESQSADVVTAHPLGFH